MTAEPLDRERAITAHPRTELSGQAAEEPALTSPCSWMLLESRPIYLAISVEQDQITPEVVTNRAVHIHNATTQLRFSTMHRVHG